MRNQRPVKVFALASFLNDLGADMIFPLWPVFLSEVLGANMAVLGFIDGLGNGFVSISQAISGYFSDRFKKRKVFIWVGYFMAGMARLGYAISTSWPMIIPFRILDRGGKLRDAPRDAVVADLSRHGNRGNHFGFIRAFDNLGSVVGIVIALLLFDYLGFRPLFAFAAIPSLLASLIIFFFIRERKHHQKKVFEGISCAGLKPHVKWFFVVSAIFALGTFSYSLLLLAAKRMGVATSFLPVLYLIFSASASMASIPAGRLCDFMGRKPVLMASYLLWGITLLGFIWATSFTALVALFVLYGMHLAALETSQKTYVSELVDKEHRASVLGAFQMIVGICALPASFMAGLLWEIWDGFAPFYVAAGLSFLAFLGLLISSSASRPRFRHGVSGGRDPEAELLKSHSLWS